MIDREDKIKRIAERWREQFEAQFICSECGYECKSAVMLYSHYAEHVREELTPRQKKRFRRWLGRR